MSLNILKVILRLAKATLEVRTSFERDFSFAIGLSKKYNDQVDRWPLRINEMDKILNLTYQKIMNELGEKEEILECSQKDMQHSFDVTSSNELLATHE